MSNVTSKSEQKEVRKNVETTDRLRELMAIGVQHQADIAEFFRKAALSMVTRTKGGKRLPLMSFVKDDDGRDIMPVRYLLSGGYSIAEIAKAVHKVWQGKVEGIRLSVTGTYKPVTESTLIDWLSTAARERITNTVPLSTPVKIYVYDARLADIGKAAVGVVKSSWSKDNFKPSADLSMLEGDELQREIDAILGQIE